VENFFPWCGKNTKTFSMVWKKRPKSSTLWKNITIIPQESDGDEEKAGLKSCSLPLGKG
jgi:hypothetical protein